MRMKKPIELFFLSSPYFSMKDTLRYLNRLYSVVIRGKVGLPENDRLLLFCAASTFTVKIRNPIPY